MIKEIIYEVSPNELQTLKKFNKEEDIVNYLITKNNLHRNNKKKFDSIQVIIPDLKMQSNPYLLIKLV